MKVDVGYFPKSYYCSKPDAGGFFPFALDGETNYVFAISEFDLRIENEKQLKAIFPYYIMLGIANELVIWSSKKNVFSLEKREWTGEVYKGVIRKTIVVNMEADTSIFWIGHDGDFIAVISNQSTFSTYKQVVQTFPDFVVPTPFKYT